MVDRAACHPALAHFVAAESPRENVSALSREVGVKREMLYRWRSVYRDGGEERLRERVGRPTVSEAQTMAIARDEIVHRVTYRTWNDRAEPRHHSPNAAEVLEHVKHRDGADEDSIGSRTAGRLDRKLHRDVLHQNRPSRY